MDVFNQIKDEKVALFLTIGHSAHNTYSTLGQCFANVLQDVCV